MAQDAGAEPLDPLYGHPRYYKVRDLPPGSLGFVQLCYDRQVAQHVAIRFIERGEKVSRYVEREILNHRRLIHPHIVEMREVFLLPEYLAITMEYAAGGDLFQLVGRAGGLREEDAKWYFQQIIVAIDYCHRMGVANRDIKLENILLDESEPRPLIKICDFGYSKHEFFQSAPGSRVGTPAYLAPEIILTTKGRTYDAKAADVWSCGVLLYIMIASAYPFGRPEDEPLAPAQKMQVMLQRILAVNYELPGHVAMSADCRDLLSRVLVADPARRVTVPAILRHPWFLRGLPEGVAEMNDRLVPPRASEIRTFSMPDGVQSLEETERLVQLGMAPADAAGGLRLGGGHDGFEAHLDGILDESELLSSFISDDFQVAGLCEEPEFTSADFQPHPHPHDRHPQL